jgi:hypothetical protein
MEDFYMKKRWRVLFAVVLTILAMALTLGVGVGAAEDLETNRALASEKYNALLDLSREYFEKGDAGKEANKYVVNVYAKSINDLTDLMLKRDGAADLINLFYEQGITAGHLAFIHHSYLNDKRLTDADREELETVHLTLQLLIEDVLSDGLDDNDTYENESDIRFLSQLSRDEADIIVKYRMMNKEEKKEIKEIVKNKAEK